MDKNRFFVFVKLIMAEPLSSIKYETTVFDLQADDFGPNKATLLHARSKKAAGTFYNAVLYIHGYNDYFFHDHLCQRFLDNGFDFFALDLRKCGRSIISPQQDHQKHYCRDLREYDEEITLSIETMLKHSADRPRKFFLFGHSTGGLIAGVYGSSGARRADIEGLILNSPYLAPVNASWLESMLLAVLKRWKLSIEFPDLWYGRSIHRSEKGQWNFDLAKKPIEKVRLHGSFFSAIQTVQDDLANGKYKVQCPVLMICSSRSIRAGRQWRDEYAEADLILDVISMKQAATLISNQVDICELDGALHDVFLSKESVRETAFQRMFQWIDRLIGQTSP